MLTVVVGCDRASGNAGAPPADAHTTATRLASVRPQLANAALVASAVVAGTRQCESPLRDYPGCEHDHGQVLLLAPESEGGAGRRVDGLLYVPAGRRPQLSMTLWHFDSLGAPLGHGWYQVTAIAHVD